MLLDNFDAYDTELNWNFNQKSEFTYTTSNHDIVTINVIVF